MRLTPLELERLTIFTAAELARRRRTRGLRLNHPEAMALICDAAHEAARDGQPYDLVVQAAREAVTANELLDGVAELLDEIRVEVLMDDGTRLIVLVDPFAAARSPTGPGVVVTEERQLVERERGMRGLAIRNDSRRVVRVGSHYPLEQANQRLVFDRAAASGHRLDLPAGDSERWAPGEAKVVGIVPLPQVSPTVETEGPTGE